MAHDRSLYSKIRVVLEKAKAGGYDALDALQADLRDRAFYTKQYDEKKDAFVDRHSDRVVRRVISTCRLLDLISEEGALTTVGRAALRRNAFADVIAAQVRRVLSEAGVSVRDLNRVVRSSFAQVPPVLPTAKVLISESNATVGAGLFNRLLTLLVAAGAVEASRRKVFTHFVDDE